MNRFVPFLYSQMDFPVHKWVSILFNSPFELFIKPLSVPYLLYRVTAAAAAATAFVAAAGFLFPGASQRHKP